MVAVRGEQLGVVTNWPPSLEAALQRWGTISPKAPCLTTMDTNGKPLYVLTYGKKTKNPKTISQIRVGLRVLSLIVFCRIIFSSQIVLFLKISTNEIEEMFQR